MHDDRSSIRHIPEGPVLLIFLSWYVLGHPRRIIRTMVANVSAIQSAFSFLFLLRTLFAPWKSLADDYPENMFDITGLLSTFFFNTVTRAIGAMIRLGVMTFGFVAILVTIVGSVLYLLFWLAFPFLLAGGVALSTFRAVLP